MNHAPSTKDLRNIVTTTLMNHPDSCIFVSNAVEKIVAEVAAKMPRDRNQTIDMLVDAVKRHEIYCPHEGIDRRMGHIASSDWWTRIDEFKRARAGS